MTIDTIHGAATVHSTVHSTAHAEAGAGEPARPLPARLVRRPHGLRRAAHPSRHRPAAPWPRTCASTASRRGPERTSRSADTVDDARGPWSTPSGSIRVIPVALSHAGWAAVELRRRLGAERVPGMVLVDWMVLGTPPGFDGALAGLQDDAAWAEARAAPLRHVDPGVDVPAVREDVASMGEYGATPLAAGRGARSPCASPPTAPPLAALDALPSRARPCTFTPSRPTTRFSPRSRPLPIRTRGSRCTGFTPAATSHLRGPDEMAKLVEEFACRLH